MNVRRIEDQIMSLTASVEKQKAVIVNISLLLHVGLYPRKWSCQGRNCTRSGEWVWHINCQHSGLLLLLLLLADIVNECWK